MINVVLMAGEGKRFSDAGYKESKPLIPVSGKPMILQAVASMPEADKWVFVVRSEHTENKELMDTLKSVGKDVEILGYANSPSQLNSCLLAKDYYNNDEPLFVGACDFGMTWNKEKYAKLVDPNNAERPDIISWSFTAQPNLLRNPQAWGWLKQDKGMRIHGVSVKIPISNDPFHDYAITGSFTFKSGKEFLKLADELMKNDIKVKNEFYIDSILELAIELGQNVVSFPVDKYIGWGVPADYEEYLWWEKAIAEPGRFPEAGAKPEYSFWKDYFAHPVA